MIHKRSYTLDPSIIRSFAFTWTAILNPTSLNKHTPPFHKFFKLVMFNYSCLRGGPFPQCSAARPRSIPESQRQWHIFPITLRLQTQICSEFVICCLSGKKEFSLSCRTHTIHRRNRVDVLLWCSLHKMEGKDEWTNRATTASLWIQCWCWRFSTLKPQNQTNYTAVLRETELHKPDTNKQYNKTNPISLGMQIWEQKCIFRGGERHKKQCLSVYPST